MGGFESSSERAQRVQEGLERLEVHFGEQGGVGSPYRKARRGQEGWERSGGPLGRADRDWESLLGIGRGRNSLPEGRDGLEGLPSGPGGAVRPFWRAGSGQEALSEGWEGLEGPHRGL